MKKATILFLFLFVSSSFSSVSYSSISLEQPPENAVELGQQYLEELIEIYYPETQISVGEPYKLVDPSGRTTWAYSYPLSIGQVAYSTEDTLIVFDEWFSITKEMSSYFGYGNEVRFEELRKEEIRAWFQVVSHAFAIISFIGEQPTVIGYHTLERLGNLGSSDYYTYAELDSRTSLVGYTFKSWKFGHVELCGIYETPEGHFLVHPQPEQEFDRMMNDYPQPNLDDVFPNIFTQYFHQLELKTMEEPLRGEEK